MQAIFSTQRAQARKDSRFDGSAVTALRRRGAGKSTQVGGVDAPAEHSEPSRDDEEGIYRA